MGHNSVVSGYPKSTGILSIDGLSGCRRDPRDLGRHNFLTIKVGLLCLLLLSLIRFICINSLICILKSSISSCEYIIGFTLITLSGSIISNLQ